MKVTSQFTAKISAAGSRGWVHTKGIFAQLIRVKPNGRPIEISKEFRDSKRNLLWASSFAILLAVSNLEKPYEVTAPLVSGLKVHAGFLVLLVSSYVGYLWLRFRYEGLRVTRRNSVPVFDDIERDRKASSSVVKTAYGVSRKLIEWHSRLDALSFKTPTDRKPDVSTDIRGVLRDIDLIVSNHQSLMGSISSGEKDSGERFERELLEGFFAGSVDSAKSGLEDALRKIGQSSEENEEAIGEIEAVNERYLERLEKAVGRIRLDLENYYKFSDELNASDTRMFAYHDWILPHTVAIMGAVGTPIIQFQALRNLVV
ncbi:hypothetical protein [Parerythrobacter aestuarii]|uniref:hypothetical protein n=1 Tax=Parerythrobacter aestuarii TaxID=3020909 RepID=UPI0024DE4932|nr:hypothetical protein [Parerythrobacter aestuarii]